MKVIEGFSKLSKQGKLEWLAHEFYEQPEDIVEQFQSYWHDDPKQQKLFDEFSENTITNFYMPFGIAPNFLINDKLYALPMVIEESSVVAAASKAAKYWKERGGFHAEIVGTEKIGQVHFTWKGTKQSLEKFFSAIKPTLISNAKSITANMESRGGGISNIELVDMTEHEADYYQLKCTFETVDAMGANFINSLLESFAGSLQEEAINFEGLTEDERDVKIIMSILSNYTPNCRVKTWVTCPIADLGTFDGGSVGPEEFAKKFALGARIAEVDPHRATTHNKGIFNGVDSVVLATGNDFRAVEACGHTYAARNGQYSSLTYLDLSNDTFTYTLEIPLAVGTVGGLTTLHPVSKRSLEMLGHPSASELMMIAAVAGLANNFSAIKSLVTVGIQKGHMKMHLLNILKNFEATEPEVEEAKEYFKTHVVSYTEVRKFIELVRDNKPEFN